MIVEAAMVAANWVKNRPEMPLMKAVGTNTAHSVSAMAISAAETSSIVLCAASLRRHAQRHVALDVLDHDDGVVDHDADGQDQAEHRQVVDRDAEGGEDRERADAARSGWRPRE